MVKRNTQKGKKAKVSGKGQRLGRADGFISTLRKRYEDARDAIDDFYDRHRRAIQVAAALAAVGALGHGRKCRGTASHGSKL
jgi:uncharacterized protein YjbJ (UPF0337 family)